MAANSDETLKKQLDAATSSESFVEIATRQGYELTVADIEILLDRTQQQAQLHSDEFDDDELSEQELELVAGGKGPVWKSPVPHKHGPKPPWWSC
jgi:predicted ribosomally synthesized peptide with nif11-like leader